MEVPRDPNLRTKELEVFSTFRSVVESMVPQTHRDQHGGESTYPYSDERQLIPVNKIMFVIKDYDGVDDGYHSIKLLDRQRVLYGVTVYSDGTVLESGIHEVDSEWGNSEAAQQILTKITTMLTAGEISPLV